MKITVFTPTYNRVEYLPRLYNSLANQTFKDFEWIIVDDGSTDKTKEYIDKIINENKINIKYFYQENSGKHIAINNGVSNSSGKYFAIVDSDDYLTEDALFKVDTWFESIKDDNKFCGVAGLKGYTKDKCVGQNPKNEYIDSKSSDKKKNNLDGDKFEVFYTEILKENPFPYFEGEKFIRESVVWNKLSRQGYYLRWFNQIIYICEYLEDGLTSNFLKVLEKSPKGFAFDIKEEIKYDNISFKQKMSYYSLYYLMRKDYAKLSDIANELETSKINIILAILMRKVYEIFKK